MVQFSADAREEAMRLALGFGQTHGVDVWYLEGHGYRLLATHRSPLPQRDADRRRNHTLSGD
jgi:hypothetical protein